ncbi:P-loop ATPase, Sll1717 family [Streptomyces sp. NPDC001902]
MVASDFRKFDFGYADSVREFSRSPRLLREGYYDLGRIEESVINSHEFLILGYKGSGKSAIGGRLQLIAQDSPARYSAPAPIHVDRLSLKEFRGIVPEAIDPHIRHKWVWELHLLIHIVSQLTQDAQAEKKHRESISAAHEQLKKAGVTPQSPAAMKRLRTSNVDTTDTLLQSSGTRRSTDASRLEDWILYLKHEVSSFRSSRQHYVFIDGLDDASIVQEGRAALLGGLIQAAADLNDMFVTVQSPVKIIVCCRTDLYARLSLPRAGKIRRDDGLELNWYQNTRDYRATHLVRLANLRAKLVDPNCSNVFDEFLPERISNRGAIEFLLLQTRHTPRDLLQLLKIIQGHVEQPGPIPEPVILAGVAEYSGSYFIGEMRDALSTYFQQEEIRRIEELLGTLRKRQFSHQELVDVVQRDHRFKGKVDPEKILSAMFDSGFLGNVTSGGPAGGYEQYFRFKFRNPQAALVYDDAMQLHPGLWKTFNVA